VLGQKKTQADGIKLGRGENLGRGRGKEGGELGCWAEREGVGGLGVLFSFLNPFSKLFQTLNTSNSFQNFQTNFKTFKTSHKQT
jgi:hypothetical protein